MKKNIIKYQRISTQWQNSPFCGNEKQLKRKEEM